MAKMDQIVSLWKPDPDKPKPKWILSGKTADGKKCYMFANDKGDNPKRPDYRIVVGSDESDGREPAPF